MLRAAFATVAAEFGLTAENTPSNPSFWTAADLAHAVSRSTHVLGVEDGARLVGCAFIGPSPSRPGVWVLRHLAVRPDARCRGHGESLVSAAAGRAWQAGAGTLRIGIVADNRRLSQWYQRLGFAVTEAGVHHGGLVFSVDYLELARPEATYT